MKSTILFLLPREGKGGCAARTHNGSAAGREITKYQWNAAYQAHDLYSIFRHFMLAKLPIHFITWWMNTTLPITHSLSTWIIFTELGSSLACIATEYTIRSDERYLMKKKNVSAHLSTVLTYSYLFIWLVVECVCSVFEFKLLLEWK